MRKITFLLVSLLIYSHLFSQTGSIRGKVIDKQTGDELIGATVLIDGTTTGTISDFDGNFSLDNLNPGKYKIRCSYISYETIFAEGVEVKSGDVTSISFQLGEAALGLKEVVVTAKAVQRTEAAIQTMKKRSSNLLDGISAGQISRMGDSDAAGALKRVTGVSVVGGKYVYVRGLGDRYMKTLLNGADIPGLDPNKNTVQMDIFPSNLIENMMINKTFSADLPGSFTGGLVDIQTKDFPERYTFQFSTSITYNPKSSFNSNFLSYDGKGKTDWLAIEDGSRDLPINALSIPYRTNETEQELTNLTSQFNKNFVPTEANSALDHSHSISVGNQIDFLGKKLGFIAGLTYSHSYDYYDDGETGEYKQTSVNSTILNTEKRYNDRKGEEETLWGGIGNLTLKLNNNHKIAYNLMYNRSGNQTGRYMEGIKPSDASDLLIQTRTVHYTERSLALHQLRGEHVLPDLFKVNWSANYSISHQSEPDLIFFTNSYYDYNDSYEIEPALYKVPTRQYRELEQYNIDLTFDIERKFDFLGSKSKVKAGGRYTYYDRDFIEQRINFESSVNYFDDLQGDISTYISDAYIGNNNPYGYGLYVANSPEDDLRNSYTGKQSVIAGYGLIDLPLWANIRFVGGLRVEKVNMESGSKLEGTVKGELDELDLLPSINTTYSYTENSNIRIAFTRTVARPTFREKAPFKAEEFQGGFITIGEDSLMQTLINNVDLRWETYLKPGEIISASLFYKYFQDPIELYMDPRAPNPQLSWQNTENANAFGFELEVRKKLDFISVFTKDLILGANFTYVYARAKMSDREYEALTNVDPGASEYRDMYGLPPYMLNVYLNYNNRDKGLDANLAFNMNGRKLDVVISGVTPDVYIEPYPTLDFNISKSIGEKIDVKFKVSNILDSYHEHTYSYKNVDYYFRRYGYGRSFGIGFTYKI
jgi:TonB-dependent receptor